MRSNIAKGINFIIKIFWIFVIGSVFGFVVEMLYATIYTRTLVIRQGLIYGPFIQVYGAGAVAYYFLISKFKEPILHVLVVGGITIYKLTMGIYNALKAHKSHDLIVISLKNINLAEALASLVALMATVLVLTKDDSKVNQISIDLVSFAMIVVTLFLGISMIRRTAYEYKKMQWEEGISGLGKFYQQRKH